MQAYKFISLAGILSVALVLSACDASVPSQVQTGKIELKEQVVTKMLDSTQIDPARIDILADHVKRNRKGDVTLTVSWLSGDASRERTAKKHGNVYKRALEKRGVSGIHVVTVPVMDERYINKIVMVYRSLVAQPPDNCLRLTGYQGAENLDALEKYQFGCEMQMAVSRMIVEPSDLLGKDGAQDNDSRRAGVSVENYKAGTPNKPMQGFQASSIGNK